MWTFRWHCPGCHPLDERRVVGCVELEEDTDTVSVPAASVFVVCLGALVASAAGTAFAANGRLLNLGVRSWQGSQNAECRQTRSSSTTSAGPLANGVAAAVIVGERSFSYAPAALACLVAAATLGAAQRRRASQRALQRSQIVLVARAATTNDDWLREVRETLGSPEKKLKERLAQQKTRFEKQKAELESQMAEVQELTKRAAELEVEKAEVRELTKKAAQLEAELQSERSKREEEQKAIAALQAQLEETQSNLQEVLELNSQLKEELPELQSQVTTATAEREAEVKRYQDELAAVTAERDVEVKRYQVELAAKELQIENYRQANEEIRAIVAPLQNSYESLNDKFAESQRKEAKVAKLEALLAQRTE